MDAGLAALGWLVAAFLVAGIVWAVIRGRKGYKTVQALMAKVDAHAAADARAAAQSVVNIGGPGWGPGDDHDYRAAYYDDLRGSHDHDLQHGSRAIGGGAVDPRLAASAADGAGVRPGARRVQPRDADRDQGRSVNGWDHGWW